MGLGSRFGVLGFRFSLVTCGIVRVVGRVLPWPLFDNTTGGVGMSGYGLQGLGCAPLIETYMDILLL